MDPCYSVVTQGGVAWLYWSSSYTSRALPEMLTDKNASDPRTGKEPLVLLRESPVVHGCDLLLPHPSHGHDSTGLETLSQTWLGKGQSFQGLHYPIRRRKGEAYPCLMNLRVK